MEFLAAALVPSALVGLCAAALSALPPLHSPPQRTDLIAGLVFAGLIGWWGMSTILYLSYV